MSRIEPVTVDSFDTFFELVCALADYEKLQRPSNEARLRLTNDIVGDAPKIEAFLIYAADGIAVGYAIILETYSSFLALPTLYLEDIFILETHRGMGLGSKLFDHIVELARSRGCGRVDWQVLDWNTPAREFYERKGADCMSEWLLCRITL